MSAPQASPDLFAKTHFVEMTFARIASHAWTTFAFLITKQIATSEFSALTNIATKANVSVRASAQMARKTAHLATKTTQRRFADTAPQKATLSLILLSSAMSAMITIPPLSSTDVKLTASAEVSSRSAPLSIAELALDVITAMVRAFGTRLGPRKKLVANAMLVMKQLKAVC